MKYSFQKLTQFSKGNKRLDGAASNKDVFLEEVYSAEYTYLEQTESNSTFKYLSCRKGFDSKTKSILTWKQCARMCSI
jgi:hypothetical protein